MANYVYIAASLDGYIADERGGVEWLPEIPADDKSDFSFTSFLERVDGIIMGRNTFEKVLSFGQWPYTRKVFVLSSTLKEIPEELWHKAEIVGGDITSLLSGLRDRGYENLYIDGGRTIQSFLRKGLIHEMIITTIPVLLGGGIPLFGSLDKPIPLELVKTEAGQESLVTCHYRIPSKGEDIEEGA